MINLYEFGKGVRENRLNIDEAELRRIFSLFELKGSGTMSYFDLVIFFLETGKNFDCR